MSDTPILDAKTKPLSDPLFRKPENTPDNFKGTLWGDLGHQALAGDKSALNLLNTVKKTGAILERLEFKPEDVTYETDSSTFYRMVHKQTGGLLILIKRENIPGPGWSATAATHALSQRMKAVLTAEDTVCVACGQDHTKDRPKDPTAILRMEQQIATVKKLLDLPDREFNAIPIGDMLDQIFGKREA